MFTSDIPLDQFSDEVLADSSNADGADVLNDLLTTNWQTTAAVGLTVASGGVLGAISLAAFPAQTLAATGGIGVLAYAGKRRADGKPAFPFGEKKDDAKQEAAPAAAAA